MLYSSWENLSLFRHLSNSSEPTRTGVRDGESEHNKLIITHTVSTIRALRESFSQSRCISLRPSQWELTDEGLPLDGGEGDDFLLPQGFGRELLRDPHGGLEVQLALEHPWNNTTPTQRHLNSLEQHNATTQHNANTTQCHLNSLEQHNANTTSFKQPGTSLEQHNANTTPTQRQHNVNTTQHNVNTTPTQRQHNTTQRQHNANTSF